MRIHVSSRNVARICDVIKHTGSVAGFVLGIGLMMWGVKEVSRSAPGSITALAGVLREWRLPEIVLVFGNVFFYSLYRMERHGKKRAIEKKGVYQHRAEVADPDRTSCGLTRRGDTPK